MFWKFKLMIEMRLSAACLPVCAARAVVGRARPAAAATAAALIKNSLRCIVISYSADGCGGLYDGSRQGCALRPASAGAALRLRDAREGPAECRRPRG